VIKCIDYVNIQNAELENQRLNVEISVVLGNGERWNGIIKVFIAT
jgi:sRNA-binding regulator protein Hfq